MVYLLQHPVNRAILLRKNRPQLEELRAKLLSSYLPQLKEYLRQDEEDSNRARELEAAWGITLKLTVLLQEGAVDESCSETLGKVEDLMDWTEKEVLSGERLSSFSLAARLAMEAAVVCRDMVTIGVCDVNFVGHFLELCESLLSKGW